MRSMAIAGLLFGLAGWSCHPQDAAQEGAGAPPQAANAAFWVEMDHTNGRAAGSSGAGTTFCHIARHYTGGAGVYEVTRIVGVAELNDEGDAGGFSYITLSLVSSWVPETPQDVVLRVEGGPVEPDLFAASPFEIAVGEVAGFVLWAPRPENKDYYSVAPTALFQERPEGGYDSHARFVLQHGELSLDQVGALVAQYWGGDPNACPDPSL